MTATKLKMPPASDRALWFDYFQNCPVCEGGFSTPKLVKGKTVHECADCGALFI